MITLNDTITTLRPDGKPGIVLNKSRYRTLAAYLIGTLDSTQQNLTFPQVLDKARKDMDTQWREDTAWEFLQVKLDLEARDCLYMAAPRANRKLLYLKLISKNQHKMEALLEEQN